MSPEVMARVVINEFFIPRLCEHMEEHEKFALRTKAKVSEPTRQGTLLLYLEARRHAQAIPAAWACTNHAEPITYTTETECYCGEKKL